MLQDKVSDITVYMSDNDRVLWISATVNTSGRLGLAKEFDIDIDHISVVDVTPTGTNDISGHMYHMFNPAVVEDLQSAVRRAARGRDRRHFDPRRDGDSRVLVARTARSRRVARLGYHSLPGR